jgi:hypothetical protein
LQAAGELKAVSDDANDRARGSETFRHRYEA